jgi:hypothetical protein
MLKLPWVDGEARLGDREGEHALDVPTHGHQLPFALHLLQPPQTELSEAHDGLDDSEDRLWGALAQRVHRTAFRGAQAMAHAGECVGAFGCVFHAIVNTVSTGW